MLLSVVNIILFCVYASVYICSGQGTIFLPSNVYVPAVLAFGDSFVDAGNNNYITTLGKANFLPYGKDFMGGKPTRRFSNGKNIADFFVEGLGVKEYLPAYLDPSLQDNDLLTGVSFASGGSGYDPMTNNVSELYKLGARRIGLFGAPPVGCFPAERTLSGGVLRMCVEKETEAAQLYNNMLQEQVPVLASGLPQSSIAYVDFYNPLISVINNPQQYGLNVVDRGCCGTGLLEVVFLCNRLTPTCPDDSKFLFWDGIHLTEIGCNIFVNQSLPSLVDGLF